MASTKHATFISGYDTIEELSSDQLKDDTIRTAWINDHFKQIQHSGICKLDTVIKIATNAGIVRKLSAVAMSFDQSGKGRHVRKVII